MNSADFEILMLRRTTDQNEPRVGILFLQQKTDSCGAPSEPFLRTDSFSELKMWTELAKAIEILLFFRVSRTASIEEIFMVLVEFRFQN